jgi:hypothetical protein
MPTVMAADRSVQSHVRLGGGSKPGAKRWEEGPNLVRSGSTCVDCVVNRQSKRPDTWEQQAHGNK